MTHSILLFTVIWIDTLVIECRAADWILHILLYFNSNITFIHVDYATMLCINTYYMHQHLLKDEIVFPVTWVSLAACHEEGKALLRL